MEILLELLTNSSAYVYVEQDAQKLLKKQLMGQADILQPCCAEEWRLVSKHCPKRIGALKKGKQKPGLSTETPEKPGLRTKDKRAQTCSNKA